MDTEILERAVFAVQEGMRVARAVQGDLADGGTLQKGDRSPVTIADFAVQAVVVRILGVDGLIAEEGTDALTDPAQSVLLERTVAAAQRVWRDATAPRVVEAIARGSASVDPQDFWTLDPIDGTKGFLRGQQYAVSLARIVDGKPSIGILGCPNLRSNSSSLGSLFVSTISNGTSLAHDAWEDFDPSRVRRLSGSDPTRKSIRFCESVEAAHSDQTISARIVSGLDVAAEPPVRLDSQAKYGVVAMGDAEIYLRLPVSPTYREKIWDHAAGSLVAAGAGCVVSDARGLELDFTQGRLLGSNRGIVVAPKSMHASLIAAIEALGLPNLRS